MSIKYKLSITIAVMLAIVIAIFHYVWGYNEQSKNYNLLDRFSFTLSEQIHERIELESLTAQQDLQNMFQLLSIGKPYLLDIVYYNTTNKEIVYSANQYANADIIISNVEYNSNYLYQFSDLSAKSGNYYVSEYRNDAASEFRIITLYNKDIYNDLYGNDNSFFYAILIYLVFFSSIVSYWFIGRMLQPLKDILWKVNEVSSVRFH
ncbi:MAG TPA: hypothetical protein IAA29_17505, partial [Candidatus Paenibacillus intestinavium]|nr:hypothetical protein [Candidatus Paenibacillus intestinavium]